MRRLLMTLTGGASMACLAGSASAVEAGGGSPQSGSASPQAVSAPTFNKDVAPILFSQCATCHRPGEVAPFSLLSYKDAKRRASQLVEVTESRFMPPWLPTLGHGEFAGARSLSPEQIKTIQAWSDAGAPEGNPSDLPPAPKFVEGWTLGEPDLVVKMPEKYELRAEGRDVFRVFVLPVSLDTDQYITAIDYRPQNRKIVHHALLFTDNSGQARKLDEADAGPGDPRAGGIGFTPQGGLGGWAPGVTPQHLPEGIARHLPKKSDVVVQVHFHPSGKVETEQSQIGLYFAKKDPTRLAFSIPKSFSRSKLDIKPGESNFVMTDSFTLPLEANLTGIFPHAHLLCKEMKVDATLPDGTEKPLIWIKNWDWNWQDEFRYAENIRLPAGTKIDQKYVFDNSAENVRNPNNPPKRVTWGEQTADEMAITFFLMNAPKDLVLMMQKGFKGGGNRAEAVQDGGAREAIREAVRRRLQPGQPSGQQ